MLDGPTTCSKHAGALSNVAMDDCVIVPGRVPRAYNGSVEYLAHAHQDE